MREKIIFKLGTLLVIENSDKFQLMLPDKKLCDDKIIINCDVEPGYVLGKIYFYNFGNEEDENKLIEFFKNYTNYSLIEERINEIHCFYCSVFELFDNSIKLSSEGTKIHANDALMKIEPGKEGDRGQENRITGKIPADQPFFAGIDPDDPKLVSIMFNRHDWKEGKAREIIILYGFRPRCNVHGNNKGVQRKGEVLIWYQQDPEKFESTEMFEVDVEGKKVIKEIGKLKKIVISD